ncbi:MAG: TIGR03619 family F420-dependent LLM class oxidoreductase [Actinomycetota bacterium]|jgi:probable F420-dependent oxidoreductase|nr:TIGR03619 family F420-dependent LLM class oxidoreductase [Actinomycetota bacterium]MDA3015575.1 TIGR03619 family F420-dependent LLM class oxidoreductase [Actinomycetota bacterium]MDA3029565.1 TIGR03619 family F420-dependent LLM class oxidoreductase [Actinomycetota bacterium]
MVQIALYAHTHGIGFRDESGNRTLSQPAASLDPVRVARAAEAAGFHSIWFPDHVCMPAETASAHVVNASGRRSYEPRHEMLDALVTMGAVASATSTIRLATSVLIAPYRHPLSDARQFATIDVLSGGRLIVGVGAGWMREEFEAVGIPHAERGSRTEECIEIYRRAFCDELVAHTGRHYTFADVSMDPKPASGTPIVYGGMSPTGARRAARLCDGLYPLFLDASIPPDDKDHLHDVVRRELDAIGRDPATFTMLAATGLRVDDAPRPTDGRTCSGTAEQVIHDVARFAAAGYSTLVCKMDCPSGTIDELLEQIERVGAEIIPSAAGISAIGGWRQGL